MSSQKDIDSLKVRQVETADNSQLSHHDEFYKLGCIFLRRALLVFSEVVAEVIAQRVILWSKGAFMPHSGYGDIHAVAAHMNMQVSGARKMLKKLKDIPRNKPGRILYSFSDIVRLSPPPTDKDDEGDEPENSEA